MNPDLPTLEPWRLPSHKPNPAITNAVIVEVSRSFGFTVEQLKGRARPARLAWARQVAIALALELSRESQRAVSRAFNQDRSNVSYAVNKVESLTSLYPKLAQEVNAIRKKVEKIIAA